MIKLGNEDRQTGLDSDACLAKVRTLAQNKRAELDAETSADIRTLIDLGHASSVRGLVKKVVLLYRTSLDAATTVVILEVLAIEPTVTRASGPMEMTMTNQITYTKLRDGNWGLRGKGLAGSSVVTVTKRDGSTKQECVGRVLWTGDDGLCLATIATSGRAPQRGGSGKSKRGTWTGCSCGSVEEYERGSDCFSCRHDR